MCVIIHKKIDKVLTLKQIESAWNRNSDGAGFCYYEGKGWHVVKGLMTLPEFLKAYEPHEKKECFIHFRIATHGGVTPDNTHPFFTKNGLILFHNGIISGFGSKTYSDSKDFFYNIIAKLPRDYRYRALTGMGGTGSKFLIIHENQKYTKVGFWHERADYDCSNVMWEPYEHGQYPSAYGVSRGSSESEAFENGYRQTFGGDADIDKHTNGTSRGNGQTVRLIGGTVTPPYSHETHSDYQRFVRGEIDWINGRAVPKRFGPGSSVVNLPRGAWTSEALRKELADNRATRMAQERIKRGTELNLRGAAHPIIVDYVEGETVEDHNNRVRDICKAHFSKQKEETKTEEQLTSEHLAESAPALVN